MVQGLIPGCCVQDGEDKVQGVPWRKNEDQKILPPAKKAKVGMAEKLEVVRSGD